MPKLACVKCQVEYVQIGIGVYAIETFLDKEPYKIWRADMWACPKCRHKVLDGYGKNPIAMHFEEKFQEVLLEAKEGTHVFIHEK